MDAIPEGFDHYTFPTSLCARFCFIGPDDTRLNMSVADGMFKAIENFKNDELQNYFLEKKIIFDRFNTTKSDGVYKLWEWFSPVIIKSGSHAH